MQAYYIGTTSMATGKQKTSNLLGMYAITKVALAILAVSRGRLPPHLARERVMFEVVVADDTLHPRLVRHTRRVAGKDVVARRVAEREVGACGGSSSAR